MSKIISLIAENTKRLELAKVDLPNDKSIIQIGGRNGQGKSSLIDSALMLFGGARAHTERPVRLGAEKAIIQAVLDSDVVVHKEIWEDPKNPGKFKAALKVTNKQGMEYPGGAQSFLDKIYNKNTIDPKHFAELPQEKRFQVLAQIGGVDPTPLEAQIKSIYDERTITKRQLTDLEAKTQGRHLHKGVPETPRSANETAQQIAEATQAQQAYDKTAEAVNQAKSRITAIEAQIEQLLKEKEEQWRYINEATTWLANTPRPDLSQLHLALSEIDETNRKVMENRELTKLLSEAEGFREKVKAQDAALEQLRADRVNLLNSARFPIEGLSLQDGEVFYDGVPFSEISASKKLIIGAAIGFAMSPELKVLLIKDAPYIDDESLAILDSLATQVGGQIIIEKGGKQGVEVIIEDGRSYLPEELGVEV